MVDATDSFDLAELVKEAMARVGGDQAKVIEGDIIAPKKAK
jgi:hypothetical protein